MTNGLDTAPRVLLVGPSLSGGGAENRFCRAAERMFGGGCTVAVLRTREGGPGRDGVIDLGWQNERSYPRIVAALRRQIVEQRFDAVLAFGLYPCFVAWLAVLGMRQRPALVLSEINSPRREYLESGRSLRGLMVDLLRRRMYRSAELYAANSLDGVEDAVRYYGVRPERARRLPNLADPKQLAARAAELPSGADPLRSEAPSICLVSRLYRRKRVDTLLQAAAALPNGLPWRIDIVGDGDQTGILAQMAKDLGIAERVTLHGWTPNPYPILARASVSVLCSEYEGFSNSVLESMLLGVPVVTSLCTSDAVDMVQKGAALGFPVGDADGLRDRLASLLTDAALGATIRETALHYAKAHELPGAIAAYEKLVVDAIAEARSRRMSRTSATPHESRA